MHKAVILIVDDKPANLLALESVLISEERVVVTAASGEEALKIILKNEIDLIILDVQMPEMDGFEVAQVLKSNKRTRNIPIIFATAVSKEKKWMMKGYDEGAIDYLFKPLDPDIVKAKVDVLLKVQLQKKELEEKNRSLERNALLINNSADIIGIIDAATLTIEEVNNAFGDLLGYTPAETRGAHLSSFLDKEGQALMEQTSKLPGERLTFDTRVYTKDKTMKWLQWKIVVKEGRWFVNARDITEIKAADKQIRQLNDELHANVMQLEATNKELESFSYSISHDLRAPLRALNGYSKMIEDEYLTVLDGEGVRLLGNIRSNARKMGVLIDDLLAFSRIGRKELQKSVIDMKKMVESIVMDLGKTAEHHATITIGKLHHADGDYSLLQQVWINLISNAIKYSAKREKPVIEIASVDSATEVTFSVKDNGSGFDMKYADKLFGVFQRLHNPAEFEGTGVGLAIVHRIIIKHGGTIGADARVNDGATFYFTLPKIKITENS
jgi:PAS domain S-box-containing protein